MSGARPRRAVSPGLGLLAGLALCSSAWAAPPEPEPSGEIVVRKAPRRPYPRRIYDDWSATRRCEVRVAIDERGRPASWEHVDCPEELRTWTDKRVKRFRWERTDALPAETRLEVVYIPPVEQVEPAEPSYWRRTSFGQCTGRVAVAPSGAVRLDALDEGCSLELADTPPTPEKPRRRKAPAVCRVTFLVDEGRVGQVETFRCGVALWSWTREALASWSFADAEGARPKGWSLILQIDGPDAVGWESTSGD